MVRTALWLLLLLTYVAMVWYGATGDTGPMGWLNALQQHWIGGYSRRLSFALFCFGTIALSSPLLLPLILTSPPKPAAAKVGAAPVGRTAVAARRQSGWKTAALAWLVPVALAWIATFAYDAWDWHVRTQDAAQRYQPVDLALGAPSAPVPSGSHLALLQGRFLWDRTVAHGELNQPETTYVPLVDRAWRAGEPVRFVAEFASGAVPARRAEERAGGAPVLARVEGGAPTAAFELFAQAGAPLAPSAALIVAIAAVDGQPAQQHPAFDVEHALLLSTVLTAVWTISALAIVLGFAKEAWHRRRRARRAARGIVDGPRNWVWIGGRFHRK